jgi:hypothetical protein
MYIGLIRQKKHYYYPTYKQKLKNYEYISPKLSHMVLLGNCPQLLTVPTLKRRFQSFNLFVLFLDFRHKLGQQVCLRLIIFGRRWF